MSKGHVFMLSAIAMASLSTAFAATPIDLNGPPTLAAALEPNVTLKEINRAEDRNKTLHVRLKQYYAGFPVFGGDAIQHIPYGQGIQKTTGTLYRGLANDLAPTVQFLNANQEQKALRAAEKMSLKNFLPQNIVSKESSAIIYIDKQSQAHYAYWIRLRMERDGEMPSEPNIIIDAETLKIYQRWDDIKTLETVAGGGFGGNLKMGRITYDGTMTYYPKFNISRDPKTSLCYMENTDLIVKDFSTTQAIQFKCLAPSAEHNQVYWSGDMDAANGGYSPANDAFYAGLVIKEMYEKWYNIPVLTTRRGDPLLLDLRVHALTKLGRTMENAYWDQKNMTMNFGDGKNNFYPLVSLDVGGHEISHGFTQQHANLIYTDESGGLNESFSDMAGETAKYYSTGQNDWKVGASIAKKTDALRYIDEPTKDCYQGQKPGDNCSISNAADYQDGLNVHYSSGVYNKMFYLLATSAGWDVRKAFDVMVQANRFYWTERATFQSAACGIMDAAQDLKYDLTMVRKALYSVGLDTRNC